MDRQEALVHDSSWDYLILLDECRFDYFKKIYEEYVTGVLKKVRSPASNTPDWVKRTFKDYYEDVVYVSANPYVNSKGVEVIDGFNANEHFYKVIDVWESGWDDKVKTVLPESVCRVARIARGKYPAKKLIIHFMQPHGPYLSLGEPGEGLSYSVAQAKGERGESHLAKFRDFVSKSASKVLGERKVRKIGNLLGISKQKQEIVQKYGKEKLRKAYEKNLGIVLEKVAKLVEELPGEGVITSDHGVLLGEYGYYGRFGWSEDPIIREVPWLIIGQ